MIYTYHPLPYVQPSIPSSSSFLPTFCPFPIPPFPSSNVQKFLSFLLPFLNSRNPLSFLSSTSPSSPPPSPSPLSLPPPQSHRGRSHQRGQCQPASHSQETTVPLAGPRCTPPPPPDHAPSSHAPRRLETSAAGDAPLRCVLY